MVTMRRLAPSPATALGLAGLLPLSFGQATKARDPRQVQLGL